MAVKSSADLAPGMAAPDFCLEDAEGQKHCLDDYRGKWVVLYFYPRDNTPGCTREACDFRDAMPALRRKKAAVLGVSTDSANSHRKFRDKFGLNFPLLVDADASLAKAYGAWQKKTMYGKTSMGLVRSTFVINPKGKLHRIFRKVKVDGHVAAVREALGQTAS